MPGTAHGFLDHLVAQIPRHWPTQIDLLDWCRDMTPLTAAILVILGIIFLLFGYYMYKWLVALNAVALGAIIGGLVGDKLGSAVVGAIVIGLLSGVATWLLMKWAVAVMGGLYGAILGQSIWRSFNMDPTYAWAGAAMGLVFFGLLSFILFRGCLIIYTSLQGAVMVVFGLLGLLCKYQDVAPKISHHVHVSPALLPVVIFVPTIIGLMFQQNKFPAATPGKK